MKGKVYLVGAGPGDPELLTLKALRVLAMADVVLHDDLVPPEILDLASRAARVYNVGKRCGRKDIRQEEINSLMVAYADAGLTVVRLKGGDPLIFGRAGEEMEALREAGVDFVIIPGVTAAMAAAASTQVPLTDRRLASSLIFLTRHRCAGKPQFNWRAVISLEATIVVYMPGDYAGLARELCDAGLNGQTPCAIVSRVSTPQEQIHRTTLDKLPKTPRLPSPALLVIGPVAASARHVEDGKDAADEHALSPVGSAEQA